MIDRIVSSAAIILCNMCDFWGPKVSTKGKPGNCKSDWMEIFTKTASGRALLYHLVFALLLNFAYARTIATALFIGSVIAYFLMTYILIPIHVKELKTVNHMNVKQDSSKSKGENCKQQSAKLPNSSTSNNNGLNKNQNSNSLPTTGSATSSSSSSSGKAFIKKIDTLHSILVGLTTLFFVWYYTDTFVISLITSIVLIRLVQTKYSYHKETILVGSYLLGSSIPGYVNMMLFNFVGGLLILKVYKIDKN